MRSMVTAGTTPSLAGVGRISFWAYGTDNLDGGNGQDAIYGGYGNDTIFGGVGTDLRAGGDELNGNAGADIITGGNRPGSRLFGGEGIDSLNAQNGVAEAIINCGESTTRPKATLASCSSVARNHCRRFR